MWRTRHKLGEAEFFLNKLDEHYYDDLHATLRGEHPQPVFFYYLSAFVSAARSVAWIMRSEYGKVAEWEQWFVAKHPDVVENQLLKMFNELRIQSEKVEPLVPGRLIRFIDDPEAPTARDPRLPKFKVTITPVTKNPDEPHLITSEVAEYSWMLDNLEDKDVVAACRDYHTHLSALVEECEARFGPHVHRPRTDNSVDDIDLDSDSSGSNSA